MDIRRWMMTARKEMCSKSTSCRIEGGLALTAHCAAQQKHMPCMLTPALLGMHCCTGPISSPGALQSADAHS